MNNINNGGANNNSSENVNVVNSISNMLAILNNFNPSLANDNVNIN